VREKGKLLGFDGIRSRLVWWFSWKKSVQNIILLSFVLKNIYVSWKSPWR